jgi:ADP-heptose:LPS heptosyltransferase
MRDEAVWINPLGGLGDTLMLGGVLKQVVEREPDRRFQLIRRTKYLPFLQEHPAISRIGHPARDATWIGTDYWSTERYLRGGRAFQCLAETFGLPPPVPERLWLPEAVQRPYPWPCRPPPRPRVAFSAGADSPRKLWHGAGWEALAALFRTAGWTVVQTGLLHEPHIRGAYSLLGLTTPLELPAVLREVDLLVSTDSFAMHAAKLVGTPAVILWGPTSPDVYGYAGHTHVSAGKRCQPTCVGPGRGELYGTPCPEDRPCTRSIDVKAVWNAASRAGSL